MTDMLSFEGLDLMLGDHAPFLMSLSDGLQEELHIIIAAAEVGEIDLFIFLCYTLDENRAIAEVIYGSNTS